MSKENSYFVHTGDVPVSSIVMMLVFGLVTAIVLSFVYGAAIAYIPFIYLNFFISLGFGFAVGFAVGFGGKQGKARKPITYAVIGLITGVVAEYLGWSVWIYMTFKESIIAPGQMFYALQAIAENGAWSIFGWTPTGFALYGIWLVEALMIIGTSTIVAYTFIESTPFCSDCNAWVENEENISGLQGIEDKQAFKAQVENCDLSAITNLERAANNSAQVSNIEVNCCKSCENHHFLSITDVKKSVDKDGNVNEETDKFITNLIITKDVHSQMLGSS